MNEYIVNRTNYYLDSLQRFVKSNQPMMLVVGQQGSGKTQLLNKLTEELQPAFKVLNIQGNDQLEPNQLIKLICHHWKISEERDATGSRQQLNNIITKIRQRLDASVIIINNAHDLNISSLAAISHLASIQEEQNISIHIILSGESSLQNKIESLVTQTPPILLLQPLTKKETFEYIKYKINKLGKYKNITPPEEVLESIYKNSNGFPNIINNLTQKWMNHEILENNGNPEENLKAGDSEFLLNRLIKEQNSKPSFSNWKNHSVKIGAISCLTLLGISMFIYNHTENKSSYAQEKVIKIAPESLATNSYQPQNIQPLQKVMESIPNQSETPALKTIPEPSDTNQKEMPPTDDIINPKQPVIPTPDEKNDNDYMPTNEKITTNNQPVQIEKKIELSIRNIEKPKVLKKQNEYYTIQLLVCHKLSNVKRFVMQNNLIKDKDIRVHTVNKNGDLLYVITNGHYDSRQDADIAANKLKSSLVDATYWVRKINI